MAEQSNTSKAVEAASIALQVFNGPEWSTNPLAEVVTYQDLHELRQLIQLVTHIRSQLEGRHSELQREVTLRSHAGERYYVVEAGEWDRNQGFSILQDGPWHLAEEAHKQARLKTEKSRRNAILSPKTYVVVGYSFEHQRCRILPEPV